MKRLVPKLVVLASTAYAMVCLAHWPLGFTFFTQQSNLYMAAVVLAQLLRRRNEGLALLKYTATVSILVTFLVYLTILAPLMPGGLAAAYAQDHWASLCLHLIAPAAGALDFFLNDAPGCAWKAKYAPLALIPPVLWLALILILGGLGIRWHGMTAPYPFLNYSAPAGWFGWAPSTASATTFGIGVFYAVLAMIGLFGAIARIVLSIAQRRHPA